MNYTYEITKISALDEIIRIKYSATDKLDYYYSSRISKFSDADVQAVVSSGANLACEYWGRDADRPETLNVSLTGSGTYTAPANPVPTSIQDKPEYDHYTQSITLAETPNDDGVLVWTVTDLSDEEKAQNFRNKRNLLLQETDWMVLSDSPAASEAWLDYRQSLRDITLQPTFPNSVTWPTKP